MYFVHQQKFLPIIFNNKIKNTHTHTTKKKAICYNNLAITQRKNQKKKLFFLILMFLVYLNIFSWLLENAYTCIIMKSFENDASSLWSIRTIVLQAKNSSMCYDYMIQSIHLSSSSRIGKYNVEATNTI